MITIDGLTKSFGRHTVLDALTLEIGANDRIALIGSNGAGKTTLIRCLLGQYGHKGTVTIDGQPVGTITRGFLKNIAFVPQTPPPLRMPVGELVRYAVQVGGADVERMAGVSGKLGLDLDSVSRQPFFRLSGGQKQKVVVTIALSRPTQMMIFDEPTANLDPLARRAFVDLLAGMKDRAMLIASHRLEEVSALVNRVIELDQGRIVLDEPVADRLEAGLARLCAIVLTAPNEAFAKALGEWQVTSDAEGVSYSGTVASADLVRFLGMISRYSGLIERFSLNHAPDGAAIGRAAQ